MDIEELRKDNPLNVAHYSVDNDIVDKTKFSWWVHELMKRSERLTDKDNRNVNH